LRYTFRGADGQAVAYTEKRTDTVEDALGRSYSLRGAVLVPDGVEQRTPEVLADSATTTESGAGSRPDAELDPRSLWLLGWYFSVRNITPPGVA
jgi:hypothetical protein